MGEEAASGTTRIVLKAALGDESLDVMNFLNEVVLRYPQAVSFAPGRPAEEHFDVEGSLGKIALWVDHHARESGRAPGAVWADLGQYGKTNGIIKDLIARQLASDEGIAADPAAIVVTSGAQEGMAILLMGLFEGDRDVLLASDPTYIGITGLARILGVPLHPVASGPQGLEPAAVAAAIRAVRAAGKRPRAVYDVPDFNNPLGTRMPLAARRELLDLCRREGVLIVEDNPYGTFAYDGPPSPTLKSLDERATVIYMGSFSKTLFPGLRMGYLVVDQEVETAAGGRVLLAEELSKIKSLTTVNTPQLLQALVGGILLEQGGSLAGLMAAKLPTYRARRDAMLRALDHHFGGDPALAAAVSWNRPEGGFFLTVALPFEFGAPELDACARDFGAIVCPMTFFAVLPGQGGREREIRLSFSYVSEARIEEGIARLARFVRSRLQAAATVADADCAAPAGISTAAP
jgi:(S)-3,5-dihydroxyphenylglycine transaminase